MEDEELANRINEELKERLQSTPHINYGERGEHIYRTTKLRTCIVDGECDAQSIVNELQWDLERTQKRWPKYNTLVVTDVHISPIIYSPFDFSPIRGLLIRQRFIEGLAMVKFRLMGGHNLPLAFQKYVIDKYGRNY